MSNDVKTISQQISITWCLTLMNALAIITTLTWPHTPSITVISVIPLSINQSTNWSINQSINWSINQRD